MRNTVLANTRARALCVAGEAGDMQVVVRQLPSRHMAWLHSCTTSCVAAANAFGESAGEPAGAAVLHASCGITSPQRM